MPEPTAEADRIAALMRAEFERERPKGLFARWRERRDLTLGRADNLMLGLLSVAQRELTNERHSA